MSVVRSSQSYLFDLVRSQSQRLGKDVNALKEQAITGRKINRPSDAPSSMGKIVRLREEAANQEVYKDNTTWAQSIIGTADTIMGETTGLLKRVQEVTVGMSNDTYSAEDRAAAAKEIDAIRNDLIRLANTEIGDRYLFSGSAYDAPAFDTNGVYQGDADEPEILIGADNWVRAGWDGSSVFQGTVDSFQVLSDLSVALNSNIPNNVRNVLGSVDDALEQAIAAHQDVGWAFAKTEDALELAEHLEVDLTQSLSAIVDADPAEAYLRLEEAQMAYSAALQVAAGGMNMGLFEHI
jgi:flagellar hook-associated protein 3 FlgL